MKTKRKIRVALFIDILKENFDGVTHTWFNIIERIPADSIECLFITPYPPSKHIKLPFPVVVCPYVPLPLQKAYRLSVPFFSFKLRKILDEFQPDIIHFTSPSLHGRFATKYAEKHNIPLVSTYHTHFLSYVQYYFNSVPFIRRFMVSLAKRIMNYFYNRCQIVYVPTAPIRDELIDAGIDPARMMIWGRGIDTTIFNPKNRDEKYIDSLCGKNTKRILFVSRLVWEKEISTLIDAYYLIARDRPDVRLIITGDGPQKKKVQRLVPGAIFTGKLIEAELARIYASCDIFLFPSISETFGNVVLEAMASGLAVIVAAQGGPKGIVKDGSTGLHAVPKTPESFHEKTMKILTDEKFAKRIKKNAIAYAQTQKWDTLCREMFRSYEKLVFKN